MTATDSSLFFVLINTEVKRQADGVVVLLYSESSMVLEHPLWFLCTLGLQLTISFIIESFMDYLFYLSINFSNFQFPRAQDDELKCLILSDQPSKSCKNFINTNLKQSKTANPYIECWWGFFCFVSALMCLCVLCMFDI